uniref:Si:ch211-255f4.7 n=1 Tax=Poecilia reticulata TaxID=8081 RepID=A0A3P9NWF0_POERE
AGSTLSLHTIYDYSPEDDSDDDSLPEAEEDDHYGSEDGDGENRSDLRHPQASKEERGEPEPKRSRDPAEHGDRWNFAPFTPNLIPFQGDDDDLKDVRADWQPQEYVEQYIDADLMRLLSHCTNATSLAKTGRSLNTSVDEIYHFFGAAILMSCVHYPKTQMVWSNALGIPAISDVMSRDRFFKLSSNLKVVVDDNIPGDERQIDKLWKVRPFLNRLLEGCRLQARPECVSIKERMIPFTGACPFPQDVPLKDNPVGIKNFVLASVDGIVLDFEIYQGAEMLSSQVEDSAGLGLGTLVIKRLSETLPAGTKLYCDRFFMSVPAVDHMLRKRVYLTGTVMKNRVPKAMRKLPSDRTLKQQGGGASATVTRTDGELCVVKWYDDKPVVLLSAAHAEEPKDTCQQWSKKDRKYVTVIQPSIVREYNTNMGGVDLSDRMRSRYRMSIRTKKWTIRMLMHFTDLALLNSWLLYRQDIQENKNPTKANMKFLEFRMVVAQVFLTKHDILEAHISSAQGQNAHPPQSRKRTGRGCSGKSRVRCIKCKVFLCLQSERQITEFLAVHV